MQTHERWLFRLDVPPAYAVLLTHLMCFFPAAQLGNLSSRVRVVRMKNVLTKQEDTIEVPSEETVVEIRER